MTFPLKFITSYMGQASALCSVFSKAQGNTQTQQTGSKAPPSQPGRALKACGAWPEHPSLVEAQRSAFGRLGVTWGDRSSSSHPESPKSCYRQQQGQGWETQKAPGSQSYQCFGFLFVWFSFPPLNAISKGSFAPARRKKESDSINKSRLPFTKLNKSQ